MGEFHGFIYGMSTQEVRKMTQAEKWLWELRGGIIEPPDADEINFGDGTKVIWDGREWKLGVTFKRTASPDAPETILRVRDEIVTKPDPRFYNTELGRKDDKAKPRWSLMPNTIWFVVGVLEFGARKYKVDNWQHVPDARRRYYDAAIRHIADWWTGEKNDPESGLPHLAHAVACLLFLMWFDHKDDKEYKDFAIDGMYNMTKQRQDQERADALVDVMKRRGI